MAKKKDSKKIKIRKPIAKKPNTIIESKKDKDKRKRVKHRDLVSETNDK